MVMLLGATQASASGAHQKFTVCAAGFGDLVAVDLSYVAAEARPSGRGVRTRIAPSVGTLLIDQMGLPHALLDVSRTCN
jgi:hypothetical protein